MKEDSEFPIPPGVQPPLEGFPDIPTQDPPDEGSREGRSKPWAGKHRTARYKDVTDNAKQAIQEGTEGQTVSDDEVEAGIPARDFLDAVVAETGGFDIDTYLANNPDKIPLARKLGYYNK